MLDKTWTTFRSLPSWAQALGWLAASPLLGALFLWRRPSDSKSSKAAAAAVLLFGSLAYAAALASTPPLTEPPTDVRADAARKPPPSPIATSSPAHSPSAQATPSPSTTATHPILEATPIPPDAQKARVAKNVDGDTIWAEPLEAGPLPTGATHKIRILEIDTPEIYGGAVECYGPQASAFAKQQIPVGTTIYLLADKEDKDRYGRFLRYVWRESGVFYNDLAVRTGHAEAVLYMPNNLYIDQMREAEAEAKAHKRGLWGACF